MNDLIEKLSNLRSQFNCFDENERDAYHTLSEAIKVLSERPEPREDDVVSRADVLECFADLYGTFEDCSKEIINELHRKFEDLRTLPSVTPKLCEDAISRRILLNDLKELITAWEKYPVMVEQIKGVETAIGYVKTIPSVAPKRKMGKWKKIGHWGRCYSCDQCGNILDFDGVNAGRGDTNFCPNCGADMRGEQDEPDKQTD